MKLAWVAPRTGPDHEWIWPPVLAAGLLLARFEAWLPPTLRLWCPLKAVSGVPCPGCGTTRALRSFASLDLFAAFRWNPLATVGAVLALAFCVYAAIALISRSRRLRVLELSVAERVLAVVVVLANWIWLVADGR